MKSIYSYTDSDLKPYSDNTLVVSFHFDSDVDTETATQQIDRLVSLVNNDDSYTFVAHEFDLFVMSPKEDDNE